MKLISIYCNNSFSIFTCRELETSDLKIRRFEVADLINQAIFVRSDSRWKKETAVDMEPSIFKKVTEAIELHFKI